VNAAENGPQVAFEVHGVGPFVPTVPEIVIGKLATIGGDASKLIPPVHRSPEHVEAFGSGQPEIEFQI